MRRKYNINDNYFEKIDTQEKAYILGLLYADGCVYNEPKKSKYVKLDLKSDDKYILEQISEIMNNNCPIATYSYQKKQYFNNQKKTYEFNHNMSRLIMRSNKLVYDLENLGCFSKKTYILNFPTEEQVPSYLLRHFVRGYLDGDGSICYTKRTTDGKYRNYTYHFQINFTGTYNFINGLKNYLNKNVATFSGAIVTRWNNNSYTLIIDGNDIINIILNWIYKDATIYLKRKFEKYLFLKEELIQRELSKQFGNKNRNKMNNDYFNIYKNDIYIGTCNNIRKLERDEEHHFDIKLNRTSVSKCLKNKQDNFKGYKFIYTHKDKKNNIKYIYCDKDCNPRKKRINQYDLSMNFIQSFDSISAAIKHIGKNNNCSGISMCCKGKNKTAYGYIWKYAEEM